MQITLNNQVITFHVESGRGKKMKLTGTPEGFLTLKVPAKTTEADIMTFMKAQEKQLLAYHKKTSNKQVIHATKQYQTDELYLVEGTPLPLNEILDVIPSTEADIQVALQAFYTRKTREIIKSRLGRFEKLIGVKAKSHTIVNSTRTWGTCNSNKELTFNYKLSMAPMPVIDYVIIHELVHILHMNHDRSFWRKVGSFDPNYKEHDDYLAKFSNFMTI